ncbi:hypothetical protein TIFTF001_016233 [Ficus carica]|uniref:Glycoside hydrolase family 19 catalytic domain-containing protein n=1 Tax=Ficus carica TaxID=3494 RepID=A0AA88AJ90_FICCA|nr:hypothetical protein TIFTF001_016233 [Ficus carica]
MTRHQNKPSCHDVIINANSEASHIPNHGLLCNSGQESSLDVVTRSIGYHKRYCDMLEDIKAASNTHEPIQVPVGPVMRARAKRFKEELNNLVRKVLQQEESVFTTDAKQILILLIKVDHEESQG